MKLIQQSKLYFKEGNSDKVYEIDLCQLSDNEYIVNFRYGRRGSNLKAGTKTPEAVSHQKAESIFFDLEKEKRNKGYQTETEVFIEMPSLDSINPDTVEGVVLQRLQDALEGRNSFQTTWKTSRVIWKAAYLHIQESIPFIIKLATKGKDELQTYAAFWALTRMKATQARSLFESYAFQQKQKAYLRNMACEGLLTILEGDDLTAFSTQLLEKLPANIQQDILNQDFEALAVSLSEHTEQQYVNYFSTLYLLCKVRPELLSALLNTLHKWPFRPPYFKHIRSIYKLAQVRNDFQTLATLSYRFEKEEAMFKKTDAYSQYIQEVGKSLQIDKELRSAESKVAFSQQTKSYFRRNAISYLKTTGQSGNAQEYIKLAVATLLQYSEKDYSREEERLKSFYGAYKDRNRYSYIFTTYPECSDSTLLSMILFGNDSQRELQRNLTFTSHTREVFCSTYYYEESKIIRGESSSTPVKRPNNKANSETSQSLFSAIKSFFSGKDKSQEKRQEASALPTAESKAEETIQTQLVNPVLFPEHWQAMPNAYVQLLMQAQMNLIHRFAYHQLKAHEKFAEICTRFDSDTILLFLRKEFEYPNKFGFEVLKSRENEFSRIPEFITQVLDANSEEAIKWAQAQIESNKGTFLNNLDFVFSLINNTRKENASWIESIVSNATFQEERQQALLGKAVAELIGLPHTDANNEKAKMIINRINLIASKQYAHISWEIVEHLILSPLPANAWLASNILLAKSQKAITTDIPISLIGLFMGSSIPEVRQNGIQLLNKYPDYFLTNNYNYLLNLVDTAYPEVLNTVLSIIRKLIRNTSLGNVTIRHLVYALIRKEKYEGSHEVIKAFVVNDLKEFRNSGLTPKDITKLIHAQYRSSQLMGYEILQKYDHISDFTLKQIISFGSHEILNIRQWCWNYFKQHTERIRKEKRVALNLLDAQWDDSREYAFQFFRTEFSEADWDSETLISLVDSIRPDVENFGKELITRYFNPENALEYLSKLSEHPSVNVQELVTHYLTQYAGGRKEVISQLDYYFRSVLTRVNKARVAKNRIYRFLHQEALKDIAIAEIIVPILDDISAQSTVQDKATCIHLLSEIKAKYPQLDMHLMIKN